MKPPKYKRIISSAIILILLVQFGCAQKDSPQTLLVKNAENTVKQSNPPDYERIKKQITDIVAKQLGIPSKDVDPNKPLSKQKVAADELDVVEIILNIEDAFGVEIKDAEIGNNIEDIAKNLSVKKLSDIVFEKMKHKK